MAKLFKLNRRKPGPPLRRVLRLPVPDAPPPASGGSGCVQFLVRLPVRLPQVFTDQDELPVLAVTVVEEQDWREPNRCPLLSNARSDIPSQDELAVFSTSSAAGYVRLLVKPALRSVSPVLDQDELSVALATIVDEDYWTSGLYTTVSNRQPGQDTDETHAAPLGGLRIDEDYWVRPYQQVLPSSSLVFSDPDEPGILGGLRLDEEYPWTLRQSPLVANRQPSLEQDELSFIYVDDDADSVLLRRIPDRVGQPVTETEEFPVSPAVGLDEDASLPGPQPLTLRAIVPSIDSDENYAGSLGGFRLDEDYWQAPYQQTLPSSRLVYSDPDDFSTGGFRLDDELWISPGVQLLPSSRLVFSDPDEPAILGGFRLDEDYWLWPGTCTLSANRQPVTDLDELSFISVDDEPVQSQISRRAERPAQPVTDTDEYPIIPLVGLDDDASLIGPQPLPVRAVSPVTDSDENQAWTLGGFRLDEEYWQQPSQQSLPSSRLVFSDPDEPGSLGGLRLDDEYGWTAASLPLVTNRQPYTDTDELGGIRIDEDSAWASRALVRISNTQLVLDQDESWAPATFGLDDDSPSIVLPSPLSTNRFPVTDTEELGLLGGLRIDEDYWQRPIYLPFTVNRQPILDDDAIWSWRLDEEPWQPWTGPAIKQNRQPVHESDDIWIQGVFGLEDDYWQRPYQQTLPRAPLEAFRYDDWWVPAPVYSIDGTVTVLGTRVAPDQLYGAWAQSALPSVAAPALLEGTFTESLSGPLVRIILEGVLMPELQSLVNGERLEGAVAQQALDAELSVALLESPLRLEAEIEG